MEGLKECKENHLNDILTSAANDFYMALFDEPEYEFFRSDKVVETTIILFLYKFDQLTEANLRHFIIDIRNGMDPATALKSFTAAIDNALPEYVLELVDRSKTFRCYVLNSHESLHYLIKLALGLLKINLIYNQKMMAIKDDIYEDDEEKYLWKLLMHNQNIGDALYQHFQKHQHW